MWGGSESAGDRVGAVPGAVPHPSRGRPRKYGDEQLLARLGMYRLGPRIIERQEMQPEVRARRRYALLAPDWRRLLSEDEYVLVEREVRSMRKRANKMSKVWNVKTAWKQAMKKAISRRQSRKET